MKPAVDATGGEPCCKVWRILDEYEFEELEDEFVARWTGQHETESSLRELARELNRRMIERTLTDAGQSPIQGEAEQLRAVLDGDGANEVNRIEATRRLESLGVDTETLESNFVSHQSIYNHFRNCLGVKKHTEQTSEDRLARAKSTIYGLQQRTELVTEQTLAQLARNDLLDPRAYDVIVDVQTICRACGRTQSIESLLEGRGCRACSPPDSNHPD